MCQYAAWSDPGKVLSEPKEVTDVARRGRNQIMVPQARQAMDKFKYEIANQVGVDMDQNGGYLGHLPSAVLGQIGGQMVRNMIAAAQHSLSQQATTGLTQSFTEALQGSKVNLTSGYTNETNFAPHVDISKSPMGGPIGNA
ncbi:MAG: alpha/beta-type small acid-soluble spore protein [Firmicutes bacterium]|nr:alpha/beta-type small acid-soluble spore protein [Bacillota bacterium]